MYYDSYHSTKVTAKITIILHAYNISILSIHVHKNIGPDHPIGKGNF